MEKTKHLTSVQICSFSGKIVKRGGEGEEGIREM